MHQPLIIKTGYFGPMINNETKYGKEEAELLTQKVENGELISPVILRA